MENAKLSLCWNCKHGMCVSETTKEYVMSSDNADLFGEEQEPAKLVPVSVDSVKTVCYWRPSADFVCNPVIINVVKQCSRFEKTGN